MSEVERSGPLLGVRVIEMAGVQHGPVSFAGMILADMGADVIRVDRPRQGPKTAHMAEDGPEGILGRGHRSIALDLKHAEAVGLVLDLARSADILIEGFRPGVMERLGLGPAECRSVNPAIVFGRITGWGQTGPLAEAVGHDINYISLSGALDAIGEFGGKPVVPVNLVGDMGGGGMLLVMGVLAGLLQARQSGQGQTVDAAMIDGAILQMSAIFTLRETGNWRGGRGGNMLDGGAPFYDTYRCSDGLYVAVGAIEPPFYRALCMGLDLPHLSLTEQMDEAYWPRTKVLFGERFAKRSRAEWLRHFEGTDACVTPVLDLAEAATHPHNLARGNIVDRGGVRQPGAAPLFDRTPGCVGRAPPRIGEDTAAILAELGLSAEEISGLLERGVAHAVRP